MIQEFVDVLVAAKPDLIKEFKTTRPNGYRDLFTRLVKLLSNEGYGRGAYDDPDPKRITVINDGDYQGTLLFIVGAAGYQPYKYWACKVSYGSCSGCDTFQANRDGYGDDEISDREAEGNYTMMLHMVQSIKEA